MRDSGQRLCVTGTVLRGGSGQRLCVENSRNPQTFPQPAKPSGSAPGLHVCGSGGDDQAAFALGDAGRGIELKDGVGLFEKKVAKVLGLAVARAELKRESAPGDLDGPIEVGDAIGEPGVEIEGERRTQSAKHPQIDGDGPLDDDFSIVRIRFPE